MLSVLIYKIHIHNPKTNAETILPYPWRTPKHNEDIKITTLTGTTNFNLFKIIPLKIISSEIGEIKTVPIRPPIKARFFKLGIKLKLKKLSIFMLLAKYNIPYEKKTFTITIKNTYRNSILEKIFWLVSAEYFLDLIRI